jgi:hypothetical protein
MSNTLAMEVDIHLLAYGGPSTPEKGSELGNHVVVP